MANRVSARLSAQAGRRFGLVVGSAFLALAAVSRWREHATPFAVFAVIGAALIVSGLLVPRHLGPVERAWMRLGHALSRVTTPVIMAVLYFAVLTPMGVVRRTISQNPLKHEVGPHGYWKSRPPGRRRSASMERQF